MMESSVVEGEEYYNPEGSEWTQKVENGQLCRVCASANEYLIPIFDGEGLEHELGMKIQKHLPIKVTETDNLPQQMCYQCASTLIAWHDLVISCVEADKKLRELQVEGEEDDYDDKGAEVFETPSLDSEMTDDVQASTSETQNQVSKIKSPKKTAVSKEKKPNLKMVLVKGPPPGSSGQKTASKTQVAKALELAKSKDSANQDSASERYSQSSWMWAEHETDAVKSNKGKEFHQILSDHSYYIQQNEIIPIGSGTCREDVISNEDGIMEEGCEEHIEQDDQIQETVQDMNIYTITESWATEEDTKLDKKRPLHIICVKARSDCFEVPQNLTSTIYTCKTCDQTYNNSHDYELHLVSHSAERIYLCQTCGKMFRSKNSLLSHLKIHWDPEVIKKFICDMCGKRFKSVTLLRMHMTTHTGVKNFACGTCGKSFASRSNLRYHTISHSEQRPHGCDICGKMFKRKSNLEEHQSRHLPDNDNPCHICNSSFPSATALMRHVASHTREEILESETLKKTVHCNICDSSFSSKLTLALHMKDHNGETVYSCHVCKKHFKSQTQLDSHAKTHNARKFVCKMCGKELALRKTLVEHERIHTGERPFCCSECGKRFRSLSGLHAHRALHSEERPFACPHCDARFRRRTYLVGHLRTHTGEKPHVCDICKRPFAQRSDMVKHRVRHNK
ncbi:zinc finger protein 3 homolog isoform X10 [Cryptotermes secundus]|uniref:zinc finger protein 3 homolog isoform X10 n=1 Tax=Cryptotermes secundus TaxID=105785 RepID=UPI000CD7DB9F|nr:zinc finger protein 3 homolog isoform X10 [Cryptotermes secundus]